MKIAICDDEAVQRELLTQYIKDWAKKRKVMVSAISFSDSESFLFEWEENKAFDLLILDIEMGNINGMELARKIRRTDEDIPIIFVTGYDRYMAQGYEVAALHYLLKPIEKEKFFETMDRFNDKRSEERPEEKLFLQTEEGAVAIPLSKLWYVEADGHKCRLYLQDHMYVLRQSMVSLERKLPQDVFVKCHRSFRVNLLHIAAITRGEVVLDNGKKLPLSRNMYKEINAKFLEYFGNNGDEI